MPVRKGELTAWQIDRQWPHQVEIFVPPLGLGNVLNDLHQCAAALDARYKTRSRTAGTDHFVRFCFSTAEAARIFWERSGGSLV